MLLNMLCFYGYFAKDWQCISPGIMPLHLLISSCSASPERTIVAICLSLSLIYSFQKTEIKTNILRSRPKEKRFTKLIISAVGPNKQVISLLMNSLFSGRVR